MWPSDSCEYLSTLIVHDKNFLDISKAFDRVSLDGPTVQYNVVALKARHWHLYKVFYKNRYQRVILNGQTCKWVAVLPGVAQGSILGPIFLIYISDLTKNLLSTTKLFADNNSTFQLQKIPVNMQIGWIKTFQTGLISMENFFQSRHL